MPRHLALQRGAIALALALAAPALRAEAGDLHRVGTSQLRAVTPTSAMRAWQSALTNDAPQADADWIFEVITRGETARYLVITRLTPAPPSYAANRRQAANFPAAFIFESHTSSSLALGPAPLHPPASPERPARGPNRAI